MMVRRHIGAELDEARIAIALRDIAEHLVVRAVFLDDIEDVLDGRTLRRLHRDWVSPLVLVVVSLEAIALPMFHTRLPRLLTARGQAPIVAAHLLGELLKVVAAGNIEQRDDPDTVGVASALTGCRRRRDRAKAITARD